MNRIYLFTGLLFICLSFTVGCSTETKTKSMYKLEIGNTLQAFKLQNQNGEWFDISTVIGKKNLVIFFYPKDDTPGCTKQACNFRDQLQDFIEVDAIVIGISGQSVESHKIFAEKYQLTYTLLSDEGNKIRKQFGVPSNFFGLVPGRVTYVIDKSGRVVNVFNSQTKILEHINKSLEILKRSNTN